MDEKPSHRVYRLPTDPAEWPPLVPPTHEELLAMFPPRPRTLPISGELNSEHEVVPIVAEIGSADEEAEGYPRKDLGTS